MSIHGPKEQPRPRRYAEGTQRKTNRTSVLLTFWLVKPPDVPPPFIGASISGLLEKAKDALNKKKFKKETDGAARGLRDLLPERPPQGPQRALVGLFARSSLLESFGGPVELQVSQTRPNTTYSVKKKS